jgi:hypothetical protein
MRVAILDDYQNVALTMADVGYVTEELYRTFYGDA